MDECSVSSHHTDLSLFAGAGRTDEHLQLDSELLVLTKNLVELLHEVLGLSCIWQVLCKHQAELGLSVNINRLGCHSHYYM